MKTLLLLLSTLMGLASPPARATDRCTALFGPKSDILRPLPLNRSLVLVDQQASFAHIHEFSLAMERQNQQRLFDKRRAYFYYESYFKNLPEWARRAITFYKGKGYGEINDFLRSPPRDHKDWLKFPHIGKVSEIDWAVNLAPEIPLGTVLFRGMALADAAFLTQPIGAVIQDKAFSSTSLSAGVAANFARIGDPGLYSTKGAQTSTSLFQIIYVEKRKARGLYIEGGPTSYLNEAEIVLDRGTRFRVLGYKKVSVRNEEADLPGSDVDLGFQAPANGPKGSDWGVDPRPPLPTEVLVQYLELLP